MIKRNSKKDRIDRIKPLELGAISSKSMRMEGIPCNPFFANRFAKREKGKREIESTRGTESTKIVIWYCGFCCMSAPWLGPLGQTGPTGHLGQTIEAAKSYVVLVL